MKRMWTRGGVMDSSLEWEIVVGLSSNSCRAGYIHLGVNTIGKGINSSLSLPAIGK